MNDYYVVQITFPSLHDAECVSKVLLQRRWVACAQHHHPITSLYLWQGDIQQDTECVVTYKTTGPNLESLMAFVQSQHPYDTPECIYWPIEGGLPKYMGWIKETTTQPPQIT